MNRRSFLRLCGLAACGLGVGFGTNGCSTFPKDVNWATVPENEFTIKKFDEWFIAYKLYNGTNPNLKWSHRSQNPGITFEQSLYVQYQGSFITPGIDYNSNYMYAAADGVVTAISDLKHTGRLGGLMVDVRHGDSEKRETYKSTNFTHVGDPSRFGEQMVTRYAHLDNLGVVVGQKVGRGDLIGEAAYPTMGSAKLMLCNRSANYVDPDCYGSNHNFMNYWDGKSDLSVSNISERVANQKNLWKTMAGYIRSNLGLTEGVLTQKYHREKDKYRSTFWDNFTIMKYLVELHTANKQVYPNLTERKFNEIKEEFYANQPIFLTLPLKA